VNAPVSGTCLRSRAKSQILSDVENGCGKALPSEDGEAMCEKAKDLKFTPGRCCFEIYTTEKQRKPSEFRVLFKLDLLLQSIEIKEIDGDDDGTADTSSPLQPKVTDTEIEHPQRPRCKNSIALIRNRSSRSLREVRTLCVSRGAERNIYRTPMRTPRWIHSLKNSQGHGNKKSEGIANASKKCRPKYIGSRWTQRKHNSSRRHIA
jgi:hypothetical protein